MTSTTATASGLLSPETVNELIVKPVLSQSIATQVSTVVQTGSHEHRVPIVNADPSASWVAEVAEIPTSELDVSELTIVPAKLAGLSVISAELAKDSSPAAATAVGAGLARDLARKLDAAYFGALLSPAPSGLGALVGVTAVSAGASYTDLDPFLEALSKAEELGAVIGAFVTSPAVALTLSKIKGATGSKVPLLQPDPASPSGRVISGVPLYVSPAVEAGTVWAVPRDRSIVVVRQGATVEADASPYFSSDRVAVRAILRVGLAYPQPEAVIKVSVTA